MSLSEHLTQSLLEARDLEAENEDLRQRAAEAERERDVVVHQFNQTRNRQDRLKRLTRRWRLAAYRSNQEVKSYREWGRQIRNGEIDPRREGPFGPW